MPLSEKQLGLAMQKVLSAAKKLEPKAEVFVGLESSKRAHVRFARNEVTTAGEVDEAALTLSVQLGNKAATSSSNQTDDASIAAMVERTVRLAKLAPEDPELMPVLGPQKVVRNELAFDPKVDALDAKGRAGLVKDALAPGRELALSAAGFLFQWSGLVGKASSAGLVQVHPATGLQLTVTARTPSGTGSGRGQFYGRRLQGLDARAVAKNACDTAKRSENPRKLEPGRYTVVLEPAATANFAESLLSSMDQRAADEGRSFFSKAPGSSRVGEQLFSPLVTLRSDPRNTRTPMLPFDGEGRALQAQPWITAGRIDALGASRFWAAKTKREPIGGHGGFELAAGTTPRAKLLEGITRGVLISRVWYTNWVDGQTLLLTGLTRDGTFLIENGQIVAPVNNFRFNQSVADAFTKCDALSVELDAANDAETVTPAMRTHEFLLASVSEAI
ncbi:MAG: TldD/PmbA family protein [Myxococcales bacterium]|nr:TldD/PmbA family protein [Myxococcales bacterium]